MGWKNKGEVISKMEKIDNIQKILGDLYQLWYENISDFVFLKFDRDIAIGLLDNLFWAVLLVEEQKTRTQVKKRLKNVSE